MILSLPQLISWKVTKQKTIPQSSTEDEYWALAATIIDIIWLCCLHQDINILHNFLTVLLFNSFSTITISSNNIFHDRTKKVEINFPFIQDYIHDQNVSLQHISSCHQTIDIFTKLLPTSLNQVNSFHSTINLWGANKTTW